MRMAGAAGAAAVGGLALTDPALAQGSKWVGGRDLSGWTSTVGDGVWAAAGEAPVSRGDLAMEHNRTLTTLRANVDRRAVMAHNLAYNRVQNLDSMSAIQKANVEFRLPDIPATDNWEYNAQTLEAALFVWDGPNTRLDYGMAIQWVLNPWLPNFGALRAWQQTDGGAPQWVDVAYLEPDTEWHSLQMDFRATSNLSRLTIDGNRIDVDKTFTVKDRYWGNTIDGRFQLEIISVWPGPNSEVPAHAAEFRNWAWRQPDTSRF